MPTLNFCTPLVAIEALKSYKEAKEAGDLTQAQTALETFRANESYFGYGNV
jgi:hypothetical protein